MQPSKIPLNSTEVLRDKNYPAYFSLLVMPKGARGKLEVLWGLATEIRAIPLSVTNPLMGFMRLSAWRDQLSSLGLSGVEPWLNSYEVFFDERMSLEKDWENLIIPEALLMSHSIKLLDLNASTAAKEDAYKLGLVLGIIYLLQNEYKFNIPDKTELKQQMYKQLQSLLSHISPPKNPLFYLLGYCCAWGKEYGRHYRPITLTEGKIQWAILMQKFKVWQKSLFSVY